MPTGGKAEPEGGLIALGVVARPHGVRGEVRVRPYNPGSDLLLRVETVWLRAPDDAVPRRVTVEGARPGPHGVLLALEGTPDREAAEVLRGVEVCVPRAWLPPPGEDEWYVADLVGLRVRDGRGRVVGEVVDVLTYPTVDCLLVRGADADLEVPMADPWLEAVDLHAGEVRVGPLDDVPRTERKRR